MIQTDSRREMLFRDVEQTINACMKMLLELARYTHWPDSEALNEDLLFPADEGLRADAGHKAAEIMGLHVEPGTLYVRSLLQPEAGIKIRFVTALEQTISATIRLLPIGGTGFETVIKVTKPNARRGADAPAIVLRHLMFAEALMSVLSLAAFSEVDGLGHGMDVNAGSDCPCIVCRMNSEAKRRRLDSALRG